MLPLLNQLPACAACPKGMTASPWNGWGGYPIVTSFMVPLDGVPPAEMQQWLEFLADAANHDTAIRRRHAPHDVCAHQSTLLSRAAEVPIEHGLVRAPICVPGDRRRRG